MPGRAVGSTNLAVANDVGLHLRDVPLLNRRPDVVAYDASPDAGAVLRPEHCALVVEVMSPVGYRSVPPEVDFAGLR